MIRICWYSDISCMVCKELISPGTEMMRSNGSSWTHPLCMRDWVAQRRGEQVGYAQALNALVVQFGDRGNVTLSGRQVRQIIELIVLVLPGFEPVHKPDIHDRMHPWFGRIAGWSRARVCGGCMTPQEIVGFWLDHLDVGRKPPLRRDALTALLTAMEERLRQHLVWEDHWLSQAPSQGAGEVVAHTQDSVSAMVATLSETPA
jgi:hypothetical protein